MKIKKFQSPDGPIEYQQRMRGAFSVNDPITAGYDEGADRRSAMRRQLYDVSHNMPYQLTNAGLWMAAPYTYGITAIPALLLLCLMPMILQIMGLVQAMDLIRFLMC